MLETSELHVPDDEEASESRGKMFKSKGAKKQREQANIIKEASVKPYKWLEKGVSF